MDLFKPNQAYVNFYSKVRLNYSKDFSQKLIILVRNKIYH